MGSDTQNVNALATVPFQTSWTPAPGDHYCIIVRIPLYQLPGQPGCGRDDRAEQLCPVQL